MWQGNCNHVKIALRCCVALLTRVSLVLISVGTCMYSKIQFSMKVWGTLKGFPFVRPYFALLIIEFKKSSIR